MVQVHVWKGAGGQTTSCDYLLDHQLLSCRWVELWKLMENTKVGSVIAPRSLGQSIFFMLSLYKDLLWYESVCCMIWGNRNVSSGTGFSWICRINKGFKRVCFVRLCKSRSFVFHFLSEGGIHYSFLFFQFADQQLKVHRTAANIKDAHLWNSGYQYLKLKSAQCQYWFCFSRFWLKFVS